MSFGSFASGLELLLDQKNISVEEKRRILATNAALELIAVAVRKNGSTLSEEFDNLAKYADAIYASLSNEANGQPAISGKYAT